MVKQGSHRLFRDATWLASASLITAAFGMIAWALTARLIPPDELGVMAAVLAAITTPATAVSNTVGAAYTSLLPAVRDRMTLYRRGQRIFLVASILGGVGGGIATVVAIDGVKGSAAVFVLVAVGTPFVATSLLQGNTLVAIDRARWIVPTAISVNVLRITFLFVFATTFMWHSYELSAVVSAGLTAIVIAQVIRSVLREPHDGLLEPEDAEQEFDRFARRVFVIVVLGYAMYNVTPFLVTAAAGAKQGALFALVLSVAQALDLVSSAMGTSLVVHAAAEPEKGSAMAASVYFRALGVTVTGAVVLTILISPILRILNPVYGQMNAVSVTAVLCGAPVVRTFFMTWWGLERARRRLRPTLVVTTLGAVTSLTLVPLLASHMGALGGAIGFTAAYTVLSLGALVYVLRSRATRMRRRPLGASGSLPDTRSRLE